MARDGSSEQRRDLLEIVDDRDGKGALLITSQIPIGRWHEIIGDPTLGDAILDRVVHRSRYISTAMGEKEIDLSATQKQLVEVENQMGTSINLMV
jgi:DNA replication protein DnaC